MAQALVQALNPDVNKRVLPQVFTSAYSPRQTITLNLNQATTPLMVTQTGFNLSGAKLKSLYSQVFSNSPSDEESGGMMTPISPIKESSYNPLSQKKVSTKNVK